MLKRNLIVVNLDSGRMLNLGKLFFKKMPEKYKKVGPGDIYGLLDYEIWDDTKLSDRFQQHLFALVTFMIASRGQRLTILDQETLSNVIDKITDKLSREAGQDTVSTQPEKIIYCTRSDEVENFINEHWELVRAVYGTEFEGEGLISGGVEELLEGLIQRKLFDEELETIAEPSINDRTGINDYKW